MSPKVFIIILNWNGWRDTFECLKSLSDLAYGNFEIILIDNASKEKTRFSKETFPKLKITQVFNEYNLGFAGGNNQGIKMALEGDADYVLLLNNDTTVEPDFLSVLVAEAEKNNEAGILGPKILFYDEKRLIWSAGGKITGNFTRGELIGYRQNDSGQYNQTKEVDYISGTCLLVKKEVIKKIGLISEDYFLYYEDNDWCQRVRQAGYKCLLVPEAKIYHKASKSTQEFSYPYIYYHSRNGLILASRFGSKTLTYLISFWIFAKQVIKLLVGYKRNWARPVMRGVVDFWRGKRGKLTGYY
ncbi:glycosyltransferase family 2 protein [Patescibacteria group bacterium]|nr:glycosyltransferase family 2 protein [Patescibacteria group bacterium]